MLFIEKGNPSVFDSENVIKTLQDANGNPTVTANENPLLDSWLFEVELIDVR